MKASEVAWAAREFIENVGWNQGSFCKSNKRGLESVCTIGAVNWAAMGTPVVMEQPHSLLLEKWNTREQVLSTLRGYLGHPRIARWNDDPHRTKQDVLDLLEKTAISLEEAGK